jgi:hypothetical protein
MRSASTRSTPAAEQVLEEELEVHVAVETVVIEVHEQVDVAIGPGLVTREGTEELQAASAQAMQVGAAFGLGEHLKSGQSGAAQIRPVARCSGRRVVYSMIG